jgi:hypothetical protein
MKKLIVLSLLVFIISLGCVSAQDINQTDDIISSDFTCNNYNSQNIINDSHYGDILLEDDCNSNENITPDEKLPNNDDEIADDNYSVKISAPDIEKYCGGPERLVVNLTDSDGNPIVNESIKISVNGKEYERITGDDGIASLAINFSPGVYKADIEYTDKKITSTITVKSTIEGNDLTKIFKNSSQYYVTLLDPNGTPLKDNQVEFNINGVFYKREINESGVARMNINLNPGTYIITAKNPVNNEQHSNTIIVLSNIVENRNITKYYKNETQYTLRLIDEKGNPAGAGEKVTFNINGVFYTRYSNETGYVKMNINLIPGDYIITADYNGLKESNEIHVLSILEGKNVEMEYCDGTQYEVKLLDGYGNPYSNQNITLNINGVFYNRTTDSKGIARLNIRLNTGEYIITATYNGQSISNKITISGPNIYDCGDGHKLELPKSAEVEEELYEGGGTYKIKYKDGSASFYFNERDENLDIYDYIMMEYDIYASVIGNYNGWSIIELDFGEGITYELMHLEKYKYSIDSSDLNIAKRVADSFK